MSRINRSLLLVLAAVFSMAARTSAAQQILWEQTYIYPGATNTAGFWVRPAGQGQVLVNGVGTTANNGTRYPAINLLLSVQGQELNRQYGRDMATGDADLVARPGGGYWFVGNLPEYRNRTFYGFRTYVQALTARGDTLPAAVLPAAQITSTAERLHATLGGYIFPGMSAEYPNGNLFYQYSLSKLDAAGRLRWSRVYPRPGIGDAYACDVAPAANGGYLVSGMAQVGLVFRTYLVQTDSLGQLRRARVLNLFTSTGSEQHYRLTSNMERLRDGSGYVLTGWADTTSTQRVGFVVRLDTALHVVWRYRRPTAVSPHFMFSKVREQADGSLLLLEGNDSPLTGGFTFVRLEASTGRVLARTRYQSPAQGQLQLYDWLDLGDGTAIVVGRALVGSYRGYVARVGGLPLVMASVASRSLLVLEVYPNPAHDQATVRAGRVGTLLLRDALGRTVRRLPVAAAAAPVTLPLGGLPAGLYVLTLEAGGRVLATRKLSVAP